MYQLTFRVTASGVEYHNRIFTVKIIFLYSFLQEVEQIINGQVAAVVSVLLAVKEVIPQLVCVVIQKETEIRTRICHHHHLLPRHLHLAETNLLKLGAPSLRYKLRKFQELQTTSKLETNHGLTVIVFLILIEKEYTIITKFMFMVYWVVLIRAPFLKRHRRENYWIICFQTWV